MRWLAIVSLLEACSATAPRPVVQSHASPASAPSSVPAASAAPLAMSVKRDADSGELPTYAGRSPIVVEQPEALRLANTACNEHVVVVLGRPVRAFGETLHDGDVVVVRGKGEFEIVDSPTTPVTMEALRIVSAAIAVPCDDRAKLTKRVIRGPERAEAERRRRLSTTTGRIVPDEGMERALFEDDAVRVTHIITNPGGFGGLRHDRQWVAWVFLAGHGTVLLDDKAYPLPSCEQPTVVVPPGAAFGYRVDPNAQPNVDAWEAIRFVSPPRGG